MDILELFEDLFDYSTVETSVSMKEHTSFKVGGNADIFITVNTPMELALAIKVLKDAAIDYMVIGKGSNLLVTDKGIRGAVIKFGERMSGVYRFDEEGTDIYADAGASLSSVAAFAADNSLAGFEFASGIPGSFGGAVFMNAGAYGGEIKDVLQSVYVMDKAGELRTIPADELGLSYRKSLVEEKGLIVLGGTVKLEKGNKDDIKSLMNDLNGRRRDKQPLNYPSAGSTFKRPEGNFAGKLIEESGLKGFAVGGAQVSEKHAGFVINKDNATADDVIKVIEHCIKKVYEDTGVMLEPEVRITGER